MLISEQLFFLALENDSGKISSSTSGYFAYGLGFALLNDLYFLNKVRFESENVIPLDLSRTQDSLVNFLLSEFEKLKNFRRVADWLGFFNKNYEELKNLLYSRFQTQGIIGRKENQRLKIFFSIKYPILKPELKTQILNQINSVLQDKLPINEELSALLILIKVTRLIHSLFPRNRQKSIQAKIDELNKNELIRNSTKEMIHEIENCFSAMMLTAPQ